MMIELLPLVRLLREIASFAAIWLSTWLLLFLALWLVYPLLRRMLFGWHPGSSSNVLLALLALPFCVSLLATTLLFGGLLEYNVLTTHYHGTDCESQFPRLQSAWAVGGVLGLTSIALLSMGTKFLSNLLASRALRQRLSLLGDQREQWCLLPNEARMVFTLGWLRNTIFITEGLLSQCSQRDIDIILEHERAHVRRKDNLRLLAARLLLLVVPGPMARRFSDDLHLFCEAACDFATATRHGALNVAETLLRVQRLVPEHFTCFNRTFASAFTGSEVKGRVLFLLEGDSGARSALFKPWMFLVLLALLSLVMVDPMHHIVELLLDG